MPRHEERKFLPYSPEQLFNLVIDIEKYPQFIPWCTAIRIRKRSETEILSDVIVGFKGITERFSCRLMPNAHEKRVDVTYENGPFKYLKNRWIFEKSDHGCIVDFYVDFEFRSVILQKIMGLVFTEAVKRMVSAFETRASALYGPTNDE